MSVEPDVHQSAEEETIALDKCERKVLRVITWFSAGLALAAVGIYVGAELRSRARFKRRTPYDFYSSTDEQQISEFGVGI